MNAMGASVLDRIGKAEESLTVRRAFGEPYEKDGVTVIPTARVQGAVGGGAGEMQGGEAGGGSGSGFAMSTRPFGVFVIKDGNVRWQPAVDVNRVILGAQIMGIVGMLLARRALKLRGRRRSRNVTVHLAGKKHDRLIADTEG